MEKQDYGVGEFRGARDAYLAEGPKTIKSVFWRIVAPLTGLCLVFSAALWILKVVATPAAVAEQVVDPNNVIYNVEWFRTQAAHIDALKRQRVIAQQALTTFEQSGGNPSSYSYAQNQEHGRLVANVTGLGSQCENEAADYNARSKMVTRSLFKGSDLPTEESCQ